MRDINASIPFDKRLWRQDIAGSRAHVAMLAAQHIIDAADADAIAAGLETIAREYETMGVVEHLDLEDIHMHVETRLAEGSPAEEILRISAAEHADLIIMATHGRSGMKRLLQGSVTANVLQHAHVPMLLARACGQARILASADKREEVAQR